MTITVLVPEIQPAVLNAISGIVRANLAAQVFSLYTLVIPLLLLGAVYEAFEIIYLVRYFI